MKSVACLLSALICLTSVSVSASPLTTRPRPKKPTYSAPILGPQPPHFVTYSDQSQYGIPNSKDLEGFNTLVLSFLLASGAADQADAWTHLSSSQRSSLKADYKAHNITLLVSAFGSTESPTTDGKDPTELAETMAAWVKDWDIDGIDVDYEDFKAVSKGTAVSWLETFTTVLRKRLPAGQFVITHAPVAPWFAPGQPYAHINATVGHLIDWYNVQFYSQGTAYTTCDTLVHSSGAPFPGTALLEIVAAGVPQEKLVLGKPGTAADVGTPVPSGGGGGGSGGGGTAVAGGDDGDGGGTAVAGGDDGDGGGTAVASSDDGDGGTAVASAGPDGASAGTQEAGGGTQEASTGGGDERRKREHTFDPHINGFLETDTLASCLVQAKDKGWNAGVMVWEYPDATKEWIQDARRLAWPYKKAKI